MGRILIAFVAGVALGLSVGAFVMLVAFPYLFPSPQVNETVSGISGVDTLAPFASTRLREDAPGQDRVHWGRGGIKFYQVQDGDVLMEFQPDFEVGPGPDFWIYLNGRASIDDENDFKADSDRVKIAKLKSFTGSQVYAVKARWFAKARAVTVWCETFGQYIASADFPDGSGGAEIDDP